MIYTFNVLVSTLIMTPLPKRKWSTRRSGFNKVARAAETKFAQLVECDACGRKKIPHNACKYCGTAVRRVKKAVKVAPEQPKETTPTTT